MTSKPDVNSKNNLNAGLYLIATPIGNMSDLSERAHEVLKNVDLIACEDTRVTRKLLDRYNISTPTKPYHEYNASKIRPKLIRIIESGKSVGLVSDAGTPIISDPGHKLVQKCIERGLDIISIPGPCAVISGLVVSGLPTNQFFFAGFLKPKPKQKRQTLKKLSTITATLIFFESNRRLLNTLHAMFEILGDRPAAVVREMTKLHEEVCRDQLSSLILYYEKQGTPRGEIVIIVGGFPDRQVVSDESLDQIIKSYLDNFSLRDTTTKVSLETKVSKRRVYARALNLQKNMRIKATKPI